MNKDKDKDKSVELVKAFIWCAIILFALCWALGAAQAWWLYAGKPITEVPAWAFWFLFGG